MSICFEGVGQVAATFAVDGGDLESLRPGMAVVLTGNGTVGLGDEGDGLCGVVLGGVRGGAATVQVRGAVRVSFEGTAPAVGWQGLACDGLGSVKVAADGVKYLVMAVDGENKTAVVML